MTWAGLTDSEAYLAQWRQGSWQEQDGELDEISDSLVAEIESAYPPERLRALIRGGGWEGDHK